MVMVSATSAQAQHFAYDTVASAIEAQGMESQRMVAEIVLMALGAEQPGDAEHLSRSRERFDQTLRRFRDGSSELGARIVGQPEIAEQVLKTEEAWWALDEAIAACIAAEEAADCDVATVAQYSEALQTAVDTLADDLRNSDHQESYSMLTNAVHAAVHAQALSQQMTKEFLLIAYGHQSGRYRSSIRSTSQDFEQRLLGLLEGDFDQLLLPAPTPEIHSQLEGALRLWREECRPLIERAVQGEDPDRATVIRMSRVSRHLAREIASAARLYRGL